MEETEEKLRVSVLVPVFNTAEFLPQCLSSLSAQILDDMEIICINDGSTDNSLEILKDYRKKDKRIKIIDKKNTGYGDSLNIGIKMASGEYIGIIESDDFADPEMFIELYALAKKNNADVVRSNYYNYRFGRDEFVEAITPDMTGILVDTLDDTRIFYTAPTIWAGLYRREFLLDQKIFFLKTPGASYQDAGFNFKTLASGGKIVFTDKPYVHYRRDNENSSVKSHEKIYCVNNEYADVEDFLKSRGTYQSYGFVLQAVKFAAYHWNMLRLADSDLEKYLLHIRAEFQDAKNKGLLKKAYFPKKHWKALQAILKRSPKVFLLTFKTYRRKKQENL